MLTIGIADAQIAVQQSKGSYDVVWKSVAGSCPRLVCFNLSTGDRYLTLSFTTTNQFDDVLTLSLGGMDEAKESLSVLGNLSFDDRKVYHLKDDRGEPFMISYSGLNNYEISKKGYAGNAYVSVGQLSKMLAALMQYQ